MRSAEPPELTGSPEDTREIDIAELPAPLDAYPFQVQRDGLVIVAVVEKVGLLGGADERACQATRPQPPACIELAQVRNGPRNNRGGLRTPS
ncbi:MAG: hypothetical protein M0039_00135, partial [Pseudomonadota bacterium]|nr:hypothetical protein [Pseudomonadota bacterium]